MSTKVDLAYIDKTIKSIGIDALAAGLADPANSGTFEITAEARGLVQKLISLAQIKATIEYELANPAAPGSELPKSRESIDRKFIIRAVNPVNGKVYDESNSLLLCAKDAAVPDALMAYRASCRRLNTNPEHIQSVSLLLDRVQQFQLDNGGRIPDTVGAEIERCLQGDKAYP